MATADARTIPVSQDLGKMIEAEVEDSPLHDMAWLGEVIDDAPEAVQAEYDRLVQLLGQDFPLAELVQRSGDGEPVRVAEARVSPDGAEAVIELFVRPGFLNVALAEDGAKALAKALKNGTNYSGGKVRYQRGNAWSELTFGGGFSAWISNNDAERLAERLDWFCWCVLDDLRREKG